MGKRRKGKMLAELLPNVLKDRCFDQRSQLSTLISKWNEMFEGEYGEIIDRNGDVLTIKVVGAPLRSELESFRKYDILDIIQIHEEFSGIRDLKFTE